MAKSQVNNDVPLTADNAMNVVLEAEQKAKRRVEQCKAEADILLQQAQQQAQHVAQRVDNRIIRIHQRCSRAITDQVKQIKAAQEKNVRESDHFQLDLEVVDAVVEKTAEWLTIPEQSTGPDNN